MANKKKSASQQQRKRQQKLQRRSARKQRQGPTRSFVPSPSFAPPNTTALPELAPFFSADPSEEKMLRLIEFAVDSVELLEEPEFDEVFIEPLEAVATLIKTAEAMGFDPDTFGDMMADSESETSEELLAKLCQQLLTPVVRRKLLNGLTNLRQRLQSPATVELRRRAAAVQFILETEEMRIVVPLLGFVRVQILNAIEAGFTLAGAALELEGVEEQEGALSLEAFQERLGKSEWGANLEQTMEQSPALRRYLDNQIDQMAEEGLKATFTGELTLNLYTTAEVAVVLQMARTALAKQQVGSVVQIMAPLIPQLTAYIGQLFTPERLAQLRMDLAALAASPVYAATKWAPFLHIKQADFDEEDAIDNEQRFLVAALLGQVLPILNAEHATTAEQVE